jgi:hypothetical protein
VKRTYPVRNPPVPPAARRGQLTPPQQDLLARDEPAQAAPDAGTPAPLPHERDESRHGQASGTPLHQAMGRKAYEDTTGPQQDTDRGPVMDQVYHDLVSPAHAPGGRSRKR